MNMLLYTLGFPLVSGLIVVFVIWLLTKEKRKKKLCKTCGGKMSFVEYNGISFWECIYCG